MAVISHTETINMDKIPLELSGEDFTYLKANVARLQDLLTDVLIRMEEDCVDDIYGIHKIHLSNSKVIDILQKSVKMKRKLEPNYGYQKLIDRE